jgi:hypothetical protein
MGTFQQQQFETLCSQIAKGEVKEVYFSNLRYGPLSDEMLDRMLTYSSNQIQRFQFNVQLSQSMLKKLAAWIVKGDSLKHFGLEYCDDSVLPFLGAISGYQVATDSLQLFFCENLLVGDKDEEVLRNFFASNIANSLQFGVRTELGLRETRQQVSLLECLLGGLAGNSCLKSLELFLSSGSDITGESLESLLKRNTSVKTLNIVGLDRLREPFITDFLTALESSCKSRAVSLSCLTHGATVALFSGMATATNIERLRITRFDHRKKDLVVLLSKSLASNSTIHKLALDSPASVTIRSLAPALFNHKSLKSFELLTCDSVQSGGVCHVVQEILESNHQLVEAGFPIYTADDATALLDMIPHLDHVKSLKVVDAAFSEPLLDAEKLLDALEKNFTIVKFDFFSPSKAANERLKSILRRNTQLSRRQEMAQSLPSMEKNPQTWPLILTKMMSGNDWVDSAYNLNRELVMLQSLSR